jgi:ferritin
MISKKMVAALNKQVNAEFYAAYLYLAMSADAENKGLKGTANWFFVQAQEETTHAHRIYKYIQRVGEKVKLDSIAEPPASFKSMKAMFEAALGHEKKVTAMIQALADRAQSEKDHATGLEMQWFVAEQIEEEENANEILSRINLAGNAPGALFMIDKELAARVFVPPAAAGE